MCSLGEGENVEKSAPEDPFQRGSEPRKLHYQGIFLNRASSSSYGENNGGVENLSEKVIPLSNEFRFSSVHVQKPEKSRNQQKDSGLGPSCNKQNDNREGSARSLPSNGFIQVQKQRTKQLPELSAVLMKDSRVGLKHTHQKHSQHIPVLSGLNKREIKQVLLYL